MSWMPTRFTSPLPSFHLPPRSATTFLSASYRSAGSDGRSAALSCVPAAGGSPGCLVCAVALPRSSRWDQPAKWSGTSSTWITWTAPWSLPPWGRGPTSLPPPSEIIGCCVLGRSWSPEPNQARSPGTIPAGALRGSVPDGRYSPASTAAVTSSSALKAPTRLRQRPISPGPSSPSSGLLLPALYGTPRKDIAARRKSSRFPSAVGEDGAEVAGLVGRGSPALRTESAMRPGRGPMRSRTVRASTCTGGGSGSGAASARGGGAAGFVFFAGSGLLGGAGFLSCLGPGFLGGAPPSA